MKTSSVFVAFLIILFAVAMPAQAQVSDDFNAFNLNRSIWSFVDPLGDATLTAPGTGSAHASISIAIPAGVEHTPWIGANTAPRIMQTVANGDFEVSFKTLTRLEVNYQFMGLLVEQDADNILRIDVNSDGVNTNLFAASFTGGLITPVTRIDVTMLGAGLYDSVYVKVKRVANQWTVWASLTGSTWDSIGTFSHSMVVSKIGVWAGNTGNHNTALAGAFDYFFNTASPINPEDGGTVVDTLAPLQYGISHVAGGNTVRVLWKTDERAKGRVEYGTTGSYGQSVTHTDLALSHALDMTPLSENTLYHYRIISEDSTGRKDTTADRTVTTTTVSLPTLLIWYGNDQTFGRVGTPQRWANIVGNVSDPQGIDSLYYTVNGGTKRMLTVGSDNHRLQHTGDFNADILLTDLQVGANAVRIVARDLLGETRDSTITVRRMNSATWPLPYTVNWGSSTSMMDSGQVVDGKWSVSGNGVRILEPGYDRAIAIGDTSWTDYEVTAYLKVNGLDSLAFVSPNVGPSIGFLNRWEGHTNDPTFIPPVFQPLAGYNPFGCIAAYHWTTTGGKQWELSGNYAELRDVNADPSNALLLDTQYVFKLQVKTIAGQGGFYRFKFWKASVSEPAAWLLNMQEALDDPQTGSLLLLTHHVDVTFGRVTVTPIPADVNPPVISNVASDPGATSATITWTTDEPSMARVAYGATYQDTAFVDTTLRLSHTVFLTGLNPATLYNYKALAIDGSGNLGTSTGLTFTTGASPVTTTLVSDEFTVRPLNPAVWTVTKPVPPGGSDTLTTGSEAWISVSAGIMHDLFMDGLTAPRIMQSCNNTDFDIEVKMTSALTTGIQIQGILVEQDATNIMRVDLVSLATGAVKLFAIVTADGFTTAPTSKLDLTTTLTTGSTQMFMRLKRETKVWSVWYSADGSAWTLAGRFNLVMSVSKVGLYAGNTGSPVPAHTAKFDYFRTDGVVVNLKAMLQGPYVAAGDSMRVSLTSVLPLKHPYAAAPWNYTGTDSVLAIPPGVVDWVLVTLRSGTAASTGVDTLAGFIRKDGSIVGMDGTSPLLFAGVKYGQYYVVVRHRNHLAIMSANPVQLNGSGAVYDFTTSASKGYGADPMVAAGTGGVAPYAMYGGNASPTVQAINAADRTVTKSNTGALDYNYGDVNLNQVVNAADRTLAKTNTGKITYVP